MSENVKKSTLTIMARSPLFIPDHGFFMACRIMASRQW